MALYAVLDGGQIVQYREIEDWDTYPEHKKAALDEKGDGGPTLRPVTYEGIGPIETIEILPTTVVIHRTEPPSEQQPMPLADLKTIYKRRIDADCEVFRQNFITPGHGQMLTYMEKHSQAREVIAQGQEYIDALTTQEARQLYPTLAATVGYDAPTLWQVAQVVIARYENFADLSYVTERTRALAKSMIDGAADADAVVAAYGSVTWPMMS